MAGVTRLDPATLGAKPDVQEGPALTRTSELATFGTGLSAGVWSAEPHVEHIEYAPGVSGIERGEGDRSVEFVVLHQLAAR